MKEETITFESDQGDITFAVRHNLHRFGIDIAARVDEWLDKTNSYTVYSFCSFVQSIYPKNLIICTPVK